jgi:hypothetical protein
MANQTRDRANGNSGLVTGIIALIMVGAITFLISMKVNQPLTVVEVQKPASGPATWLPATSPTYIKVPTQAQPSSRSQMVDQNRAPS